MGEGGRAPPPCGKQRPGPEAVVVNGLGSLTPMEKGAHNSFGREFDFYIRYLIPRNPATRPGETCP